MLLPFCSLKNQIQHPNKMNSKGNLTLKRFNREKDFVLYRVSIYPDLRSECKRTEYSRPFQDDENFMGS